MLNPKTTIFNSINEILNQDFDNDGVPDPNDPRFEFCDSRPVDGRACLDTCLIDTCGDGVVQDNFGETCDDGIDNNSNTLPNACRENCRVAFCGDGVIDDGATIPAIGHIASPTHIPPAGNPDHTLHAPHQVPKHWTSNACTT